jgi:CTD kinase subunit beta
MFSIYYIKQRLIVQTFDGPSKAVIGLERLMLESSGFDFRARHPHKHLIKLAKDVGIDREVAKLAYTIMLDLCRTFAPIKQTCAAMSAACIELATRISGQEHDISPDLYRKWRTTRAEVVETVLDLLDLYTHFQKSSIVGPSYDIETFIQLKIQLNQGGENIRYTEEHQAPKTNGARSNIKTPKTPITPASPSDTRVGSKDIMSPATLSPRSSSSRRGLGVRGQDGTVRFMLDAEEAKQEQESVNEYFKVEYEEYEVEVEETIKYERNERHERPHNYNYRNGRGGDDRYHHKRVRR